MNSSIGSHPQTVRKMDVVSPLPPTVLQTYCSPPPGGEPDMLVSLSESSPVGSLMQSVFSSQNLTCCHFVTRPSSQRAQTSLWRLWAHVLQTIQSTETWLRNFLFTPLGSFVKSQSEKEPNQNQNATIDHFFYSYNINSL